MAYGIGEQLEPDLWKEISWNPNKPWRVRRRSAWRGYCKQAKSRRERQRVRLDILCPLEYKRYKGWEY